MTKIPVGKTIAYAYAFTFGQIGTVIGLVWLPFAISVGLNFLSFELIAPAMDEAAVRANPALAFRGLGYSLLIVVAIMFFQAVVAVAVIRQALGLRSGGAIAHLAAGRDEWRMFGGHLRYLGALIGIFIIAYLGTLIIGFLVMLVAGALAGPSASMAVAGFAGLLVAGGIVASAIYALVRMGFVLSPSIVAEPKGGIVRSYELTKGNFWRIVMVWLAVGLPLLAAFVAVEYALFGHTFAIDTSNLPTADGSKAAAELMRRLTEAMNRMNAEMTRQFVPLQVASLVYGIFSAALGYSAAAFAYRALVPAASAANAGG